MFRVLLLLVCLLFTSFGSGAIAAPGTEQLAQEIGSRITRVPEFEFIRQQAEKLGVKVYLFGGTAAAYAHYVKQDLAREAGDKHYPDFFYDYDYTNIFRSTQDLDVVVDGPADKAAQLESILKHEYPHFMGASNKWEVRPLRESRGDKDAILDNPDFQNQHTDSHSTGMVEVTKPVNGESAVKDVRDWNSKDPQFLKDVAESKLHYYFNSLHETTKRARAGMNPPILSAIRYLTKAFQYDLEINGEDRKKIQKIVADFNPASIKDDYVGQWIEKNGKKLFQHAVDIEYAWNTIEELGLRKKLIAINNDEIALDSLAWWMSREPLRTKVVGEGYGKTAAQIAAEWKEDKLVVAHESNSFLSWESITRSKAGELNGLVSRNKKSGEMAVHGEGFYARLGRAGARGTGFTIRMEIDPAAREGHDFDRSDDYFVIKNKAAVRLIPEQINISLPEYFRHLADEENFSPDDRALFEAFKRKAGRSGAVSAEDEAEVVKIVKAQLKGASPSVQVVSEWADLALSQKHPEIAKAALDRYAREPAAGFTEVVGKLLNSLDSSQPYWWKWMEQYHRVAQTRGREWDATELTMNTAKAKSHPEWMNFLRSTPRSNLLATDYIVEALQEPKWINDPHFHAIFLDAYHQRGGANRNFLGLVKVLEQPATAPYDDLVDLLIDAKIKRPEIAAEILTQPHWQTNPKWKSWADTLLSDPHRQTGVLQLLRAEEAGKYPEFIDNEIRRGMKGNLLGEGGLARNHWHSNPRWREWMHQILPSISDEISESFLVEMEKELINPTFDGYAEFKELVGLRKLTLRNVKIAINHGHRLGEHRPEAQARATCQALFQKISRGFEYIRTH